MPKSAEEEKAKLYKTIRVVIIIAVVLFLLFIAMTIAVPILNMQRY
jgi:hypothetical protein